MWELWLLSQKIRQRPSDILGVDGSAARYFLDRAVWLFGVSVEDDLNIIERYEKDQKIANSKRRRTLNLWLGEKDITRGSFKDPATRFS